MTLTHVLLFFLLLGAFCFCAGASVTGALQLAAARRERPSEVYALLRPTPDGAALVAIGALLTLGFGVALAAHDRVGLSTPWIQAALGLWVAGVALGGYGAWTVRHTRHLARRSVAKGQAPRRELHSLVGARIPLCASWASGLLILCILGLTVWQPTGSSTPRFTFAGLPASTQRAIAHSYPQLAYLPTRLPPGLHYTAQSLDGIRGFEFSLGFNGPSIGRSNPLEYSVEVSADCAAQGATQSFRLNGVDVFWSGSYTNTRAWRCITSSRSSFTISAFQSVFGDGDLVTPKERHDAFELARVVAYAEPMR